MKKTLTMDEIRDRQAAAERPLDNDGYGTETVVIGHCRSTIRGSAAERLKTKAFLLEMHYVSAHLRGLEYEKVP